MLYKYNVYFVSLNNRFVFVVVWIFIVLNDFGFVYCSLLFFFEKDFEQNLTINYFVALSHNLFLWFQLVPATLVS